MYYSLHRRFCYRFLFILCEIFSSVKWRIKFLFGFPHLLLTGPRVCLENAFCKMCVTVCGKFVPDEGVVAGYGNRIRDKGPAKWGVQIAGMIFQTGPSKKESCLQDSPPAAGRFSDIYLSTAVQSCPVGLFYAIGDSNGISYCIKKVPFTALFLLSFQV